MSKKDLTRRDFLKATAAIGAVASLGCDKRTNPAQPSGQTPAPAGQATQGAASPAATRPQTRKARVVLVRDEAVLDPGGLLDPKVLERMLDDGLTALLGAADAPKAWSQLLAPADTLGIKSNVWRFLPTPPELEQALRQRALAVGIPAERIAIDDRGVLNNPVFAKASALINVRTLRTHHWSGIGSCLKNYIMFHPEPSSWHADACAELAGLWELPIVRGKTRLNIQVALSPLFHGKGPHHFNAEYTWPYKGLILSQDPVATDAVALRLLEAKRQEHFGQNQPFAVPPKHVQVAQDKFGLGVADLDRIELIKLGWEAGALI